MVSLSRGALIHGHGITFTPSNATRTITTTTTTTRPPPSNLNFSSTNSRARFCVRASSSSSKRDGERNHVIQKIRSTAATIVLTAATALMIGKLSELPARAESPVPVVEELVVEEEEVVEEVEQQKEDKLEQEKKKESPLTEFLESSPQAIDALKSLLQEKLELGGEDEEALTILKRLVSAQPLELQWKFMMGRVLNELGEKQEARKVFEEILVVNPLSFEALFQNALLMDQCGEGEVVLRRLEEALKLAEREEKESEARDVRFIMAQVHYLQKNIDEALKSYQQLEEEDPKDYRPFFARGVIYSLLDRNAEAKEQFAKCHELSPAKFKVQGFVQTPLSRTELFTKESDS